jgi:hypothetical protein
MPRLLGSRMRSEQVWRLGWAVTLCVLPAAGWADSLPSNVRACAAENDPARRLACYDREVARFQEPKGALPESSRPEANPGTPPGQQESRKLKPAPQEPAPAPQIATKRVPPASDTLPASASSAAPPVPDSQVRPAQANTAKEAGHLSAHIVSIEHTPNEMVLHLDNGQIWQEAQSTSGDLSLQIGDAVKIDKHLGSYWLSGPHVSGMKVRQKT